MLTVKVFLVLLSTALVYNALTKTILRVWKHQCVMEKLSLLENKNANLIAFRM